EWISKALVNKSDYEKKYKRSIKNNDEFWKKEGKRINWIKPYSKIKNIKYSKEEVRIKWYEDGTLNASSNCIDRHLKDKKDKTAIIWVGDDPKDTKKISYKQLHKEVSKVANGLKVLGIKKGDRVTIYLTMIPELAITMLACARIGAIHSIIFGGFSAESISGRVNDCKSEYIITSDEGVRGGKIIPLKDTVDEALLNCPNIKKCIVVKRTGNPINWVNGRDIWYEDLIKNVSYNCEPEEMGAEDPLFILYTSGSTGKPKGVLHTTGGYMVYASMTHQYIFNYKSKDIYWCTADIGWVTGHSYIIYGPLSNGATTIMFEGVPTYPDSSRWWQIIDKYKVNIFYTAPTAIRALMREGDVSKFSIDLFNYLRPEDLNYNFAVSDENKMLRLFFQKEFSVLNTTNKNQALKAFQGKIQKKNIQAFTLDKILSKGKYKNKRIDFLNIDVEGADLNVLKGLSFNIYKPELICVEIHDRQVKNSDVYKFLSLKNYKLMWSGVFSHLFRTKSSLL
ncbi:AMP-binding protein, partial [Candidatus Pelagibacter sp.]|nr:AMP-binding protein [Candidatus Pelagibacter sp.]